MELYAYIDGTQEDKEYRIRDDARLRHVVHLPDSRTVSTAAAGTTAAGMKAAFAARPL